LSTKIHALVGEDGLPLRLVISPGQASDKTLAPALLARLPPARALVADRGYDAKALLDLVRDSGGEAHIPTCRDRKIQRSVEPTLYRQRNLIERFFCKLKHFRRIATRFDKLARNFLSALALAAARLWTRHYESTTYVGDPTKQLTLLADSISHWVLRGGRTSCVICSGCLTGPGRL
jgi:transposase